MTILSCTGVGLGLTFPNVKNDAGASTKAQNNPCFFFWWSKIVKKTRTTLCFCACPGVVFFEMNERSVSQGKNCLTQRVKSWRMSCTTSSQRGTLGVCYLGQMSHRPGLSTKTQMSLRPIFRRLPFGWSGEWRERAGGGVEEVNFFYAKINYDCN